MLEQYLFVFFVAMVPVIELRGAIPIGLGLGLDVLPTYIVAVAGNMLPVPIIYLFARKFLIWGYHKPLIGGICKFFVVKGEKAGRALEAKAGRGLVAALLIFVGIPLPGTGAWTGTLAGSILDMKFKDVLVACMGGVLLAGVIIGLSASPARGCWALSARCLRCDARGERDAPAPPPCFPKGQDFYDLICKIEKIWKG